MVSRLPIQGAAYLFIINGQVVLFQKIIHENVAIKSMFWK